MGKIKRTWYLLLPALALAFGYFFLGVQSSKLEFKARTYPAGFRELVLNSQSTSRPTSRRSVFVSIPESRSVEIADPPETRGINLCEALFRDPTSPTLGDDNANVTLVEFFDYRCPYCKTLTNTISQIQGQYRIRVIYKEWPIRGKSSAMAARAALAASKQGKYHEFHTRLMRSRFIPTVAYIDDLGTQFGIDRSRFREDMNANETTLAIRRTFALAAALGLVGTPSLVVGRTIVQGAISRAQLESLIEIEASSRQSNPCQDFAP